VHPPKGEKWGYHIGSKGLRYVTKQSHCEEARAWHDERASRATGPVDSSCSRLLVTEGEDYWVFTTKQDLRDGAVGMATKAECDSVRDLNERAIRPTYGFGDSFGTCQPVGVKWSP
jgi:hypothetical protein